MSTPIKRTYLVPLPRLTGARDRVAPLLEFYRLPADLAGASISLDAWRTVANTDTFTQELLHELLVVRGAIQVYVIRLGRPLRDSLLAAARMHGVLDRIHLASGDFRNPDPELVPGEKIRTGQYPNQGEHR